MVPHGLTSRLSTQWPDQPPGYSTIHLRMFRQQWRLEVDTHGPGKICLVVVIFVVYVCLCVVFSFKYQSIHSKVVFSLWLLFFFVNDGENQNSHKFFGSWVSAGVPKVRLPALGSHDVKLHSAAGRPLSLARPPGSHFKVQQFRRTICCILKTS